MSSLSFIFCYIVQNILIIIIIFLNCIHLLRHQIFLSYSSLIHEYFLYLYIIGTGITFTLQILYILYAKLNLPIYNFVHAIPICKLTDVRLKAILRVHFSFQNVKYINFQDIIQCKDIEYSYSLYKYIGYTFNLFAKIFRFV